MSDEHEFRLEPTEGKRTGGPPGERFVVGLALFALFAGVLIALGKLIGQPAAVSSAGSPAPSPTASSTPAWPVPPAHLLREITLQPAAAPTPAPSQPNFFSGGIRAKADLIIRANPAVDAIQLGILAEGALAFAEELPDPPPGKLGWLHILGPQEGWVATTDGGAQMVDRLGFAPVPVSGDIWGVSGGGDRFLAVGWRSGTSTQPQEPLIAASSDGNAWQVADLPASAGNGVVSWGPAGWLAIAPIGDHPSGSAAWVWQSNDGVSWTALGTMPDSLGQYPSQIVSSDAGYLLAATTGRGPDSTLWFSEDGFTWREMADTGMSSGDWLRLAAGPNGFYAWDVPGQQPDSRKPGAVYSANARTWSAVTGGPEGASAQIVAVGAEWVGTDVDPASGSRRVWLGQVEGDRLSWKPESDEGAFGNGVVSTMVSDGEHAVAFGWDRPVERPMAWIREGTAWARSPLPAAFGGLPRIAAGGKAGVVVVGYRPTLRGENAVFWHVTPDGSWIPETDPLLTVVANPSSRECGPAPVSAADFLVLDRALAVVCLGDTPATFRAWSLECSGCFGGATGSGMPAWLATPDTNQLALSPIEGFDGWWAPVVLDPVLEQDRAWKNTWLEVTGHFDDPAAKACKLTPTRDEEAYYTGRQSVIDSCRQQFVVTSVTPVPGP